MGAVGLAFAGMTVGGGNGGDGRKSVVGRGLWIPAFRENDGRGGYGGDGLMAVVGWGLGFSLFAGMTVGAGMVVMD